jgi:transcriptional regulator
MLPFVYDPGMRTLRGISPATMTSGAPGGWRGSGHRAGTRCVHFPAWCPSKAEHGCVVPTWNYVTAHVQGRLAVHDDPAWSNRMCVI